MAIRAKQDALARLNPGFCERSRDAIVAKVELFGSRVDVMELQCTMTSRICTDRALAPRLLNQFALDRPATSRYSFRSA
jgi:hypothetical protein